MHSQRESLCAAGAARRDRQVHPSGIHMTDFAQMDVNWRKLEHNRTTAAEVKRVHLTRELAYYPPP